MNHDSFTTMTHAFTDDPGSSTKLSEGIHSFKKVDELTQTVNFIGTSHVLLLQDAEKEERWYWIAFDK